MFGFAAMHDRDVTKAEVLQLPEQAGGDVDSRAEVAEESVVTAAKSARRGGETQTWDEGTQPGLLPP